MKNKLICMVMVVLLLVSGFIMKELFKEEFSRTHQHLEAKKTEICQHEDDLFCTHLPLLSITQNNGKAMVKLFDQESKNHHITDVPTQENLAMIRYRGNSSRLFDKKSYKLNFVNEDLSENKVAWMGMPKHDEWVLNGPFLDKTLLRNYLCLNIAGEIMESTPQVRFCEVYLDGAYQGVYLAMESVARGEERVDISKSNPKDFFTSYILKGDRATGIYGELDTFSKYVMRMGSGTVFSVEYPAPKNLTLEQKTFIEREFSAFEKTLYSFDYNDKNYGYESQINTASFVDYMIINEFFQNADAGIFSTYFYKDIRGKINIGPVWDFNNACDNYMEVTHDGRGFFFPSRSRYFMLLKEDSFTEAVIRRYRQLRKTVLSEEKLLTYIDDTVSYLGDAVSRNDAVWGYSYDVGNLNQDNKLYPDERNLESYEEAVSQLKQFVIKRGDWLDENIENLKQYSHESKVKKFNH